MRPTVDTMTEVLADLLRIDPIDYGDLKFEEPELCRLVLSTLVAKHEALRGSGMSAVNVNTTYLLTTAVLMLENLVLRARLLMRAGEQVDVHALLDRYSIH
ncbi:hypothetical protein [Paraburkholderia pallida]|uniref:Uncharacterized protein n=1 Tax=Paraburkholderia pallida TaxID=2547399 RepID=A0A4P7D3G0_9BURK|nr:hypothetical protein [Paraburkholderia pallida]QBR02488.1 hypothetical protein E1956_35175 [Paraburkholderia pallida]